jgi:hypothetical protein
MQATITNSGWVVSRNKFGQYSYSKVDAKRMGSVSQTRDFGFVLVITCLVTGKVRKMWNLASVEEAKETYENF